MKNGELKIEKGIPIPMRSKGISVALRKLKVGESVLLPTTYSPNFSQVLGVGSCTVRRVDGGFRVWRIK